MADHSSEFVVVSRRETVSENSPRTLRSVASVHEGNASECAKCTFTGSRGRLSRCPQPMALRCLGVLPLGPEPQDPFTYHHTTSG